jgi:hypothetical protein
MDAVEFDKVVGTALRQTLNSGVTPCLVMGILEAMKLDVYSHMNESNKKQGNGLAVLTPGQASMILKQKRGGN